MKTAWQLCLGMLFVNFIFGCSRDFERHDAEVGNGTITNLRSEPPQENEPQPQHPVDEPHSSEMADKVFNHDRDTFFGESRSMSAGLAFCEDFEKGLDSRWQVTGTPPTVDSTKAARGSKSLHIKTDSGKSHIVLTEYFPAQANSYYGRFFIFFATNPSAHWTVMAASGSGTPGEVRLGGERKTIGNVGPINRWGVGTDSAPTKGGTGDWTMNDDDPKGQVRAVPLNEWMCIEFFHNGQGNETRFWWDEVEHPSLHTTETRHGGNSNPWILPQFEKIWFGWSRYQSDPQVFEMWIDEIALDSKRIGCEI